jgi:hypothetical protein
MTVVLCWRRCAPRPPHTNAPAAARLNAGLVDSSSHPPANLAQMRQAAAAGRKSVAGQGATGAPKAPRVSAPSTNASEQREAALARRQLLTGLTAGAAFAAALPREASAAPPAVRAPGDWTTPGLAVRGHSAPRQHGCMLASPGCCNGAQRQAPGRRRPHAAAACPQFPHDLHPLHAHASRTHLTRAGPRGPVRPPLLPHRQRREGAGAGARRGAQRGRGGHGAV